MPRRYWCGHVTRQQNIGERIPCRCQRHVYDALGRNVVAIAGTFVRNGRSAVSCKTIAHSKLISFPSETSRQTNAHSCSPIMTCCVLPQKTKTSSQCPHRSQTLNKSACALQIGKPRRQTGSAVAAYSFTGAGAAEIGLVHVWIDVWLLSRTEDVPVRA